MRLEVADIDRVHGVAFALDIDYGALALRGNGYGIKIDARGKHAAVVMVGVVAADFGSAGCAEETRLTARTVKLLELADNAAIALFLSIDGAGRIEL